MKKLLLCSFLLSALNSNAQLSLIQDYNPGLGYGAFGYLTPTASGIVYFGDNGTTGNELYKYDGTAISLLYDMQAGTASSAINTSGNFPLPVINGVVYLYADSISATSRKIKKYDGTTAPAYINSSITYSNAYAMIAFNSKLYFSGKTTTYGQELYVYDPALNDVKLVKDINTGTLDGNPGYFTICNGKLYFLATTAAAGSELFCYDPGPDTAGLVYDINPGTASASIGPIHAYNNKIYFSANDGTHGRELFEYSGTGAPQRLTDINPGTGNSLANSDILSFNGALYFSAQDASSKNQLFKYDFTTHAASLFQTIATGKDATPHNFYVYNSKLFFVANNGTDGAELWMYDGAHPASMIANINTGTGGSSSPDCFTIYNNDLYFVATGYTEGRELYKWHETITSGSVASVNFPGEVTLYPNPTTKDATLDITLKEATTLQITITDIQGRVVFTIPAKEYSAAKHSITIPMQSLSTGTYLYRISNVNGKLFVSGKVMKE